MSLMKKYLSKEVLDKYRNKRTKFGGSLDQCLKSGMQVPDSEIGIFATDPDAYVAFSDLFDPIIRDLYQLPTEVNLFTHPQPSYGEDKLSALDLSDYDSNGLILSSRVRVGRNLADFPHSLIISEAERLSVEKRVEKVLSELPVHLQGCYRRLPDIPLSEREELCKKHILFHNTEKFLEPAGVYRDWPSGRGIFRSHSDAVHVWINEEDHIRVISMETGAKLHDVYGRLIEAVKYLGMELEFARDDRIGYLTVCPSNLGTALRASVLMRLPKVSALPKFKDLCHGLGLAVRGTHGENTSAEDGVFDISNKSRFGVSEFDAIHQVAQGVRTLLLIERCL